MESKLNRMEENRDKIKSPNESGEKKQSQEISEGKQLYFFNITLKDKSGNLATLRTLTGEQINLPCRRIPNTLSTYSTLKRVEHNSQLLKCRLSVVTSSKMCNTERMERNIFTVEKLDKNYLS